MNTLFSFFKKSIGAVIMTVLLLPAVASAQYIITATPNNATMGSASGGGNFSLGQTFTLTATPNNGYEFVRWEWEGNDLGNDNPFMMEIDASLDPGTYAFVAVFRAIPRQYNLNIVVQPVADAGTVDGAGLRPGGNKVLTAEETNPQYHWVGWFTSAQGETAVELGYQYIHLIMDRGFITNNMIREFAGLKKKHGIEFSAMIPSTFGFVDSTHRSKGQHHHS